MEHDCDKISVPASCILLIFWCSNT